MGTKESPKMRVNYMNNEYWGVACIDEDVGSVLEVLSGMCPCERPMSHDLERVCSLGGHGAWSEGEHRGLGSDPTDLRFLEAWAHPAHGVRNELTVERPDGTLAYSINLNGFLTQG